MTTGTLITILLLALGLVAALRAVVVALHHWQSGDGQLSTTNAETLLDLLADAEAKLQLP